MLLGRNGKNKMGNTTIIEIDHDLTHEIEDDKDAFVACVLEQCRAATYTGQRIPGGRIAAFFHRSGPLVVNVKKKHVCQGPMFVISVGRFSGGSIDE